LIFVDATRQQLTTWDSTDLDGTFNPILPLQILS